MRDPRLAVVLTVIAATGASAQEVPTFATGVETVYVDVWVGEGETPVAGLSALRLRAHGRRRAAAGGARGHLARAADAVLVFDTSASVGGRPLEAPTGAAKAFLEGLAPPTTRPS